MTLGDKLSIAGLVVSVISLCIGTAVTIIVYRLSRKLDFRTRMQTRDELRGLVRTFAYDTENRGHNPEVRVVNADRYERDYDGGNKFTRHGHVQLRAEYLGLRHNGIALIKEIKSTWLDAEGRRVLRRTDTPAENVLEVGLVPFENIEHIDPDGNEYGHVPIIYARFRGRGRSPYVSYTYHKGTSVSTGSRGRPHYPQINELGVHRLSLAQGTKSFWRWVWVDHKMRRNERRLRRRLHASASQGD
jgi:hypothetical protein